jgi:hypothetical protein
MSQFVLLTKTRDGVYWEGSMDKSKELDTGLLKSKIPDSLVHKIRREAAEIEFGKIVLNISPKHIKMEYTRFEPVEETR